MGTSTSRHVVEDCRGLIRLYGDGTVERKEPVFNVTVEKDDTVLWKEVEFDSTYNLPLRLFRPRDNVPNKKLPILFYFHGGGFCFGHSYWAQLHNCCLRLASQLHAVIVLPDYRLAPENRLPAAFEDAVSSINWLRTDNPDTWLTDVADFEKVFVIGDSSGGTIAHHLAVGNIERAISMSIRGYILVGPFFGGTHRTKSEEDCPKDANLNLEIIDQFWRLSLPVGSNADHPFSNPFGPDSVDLATVRSGPMMVVVAGRDLLRDRGVDYAERLKSYGKRVELVEFEEEEHGFLIDKPESEASGKLREEIKMFVVANSDGLS